MTDHRSDPLYVLGVLLVVATVFMFVGGMGKHGYWYCDNKGPANLHRYGRPTAGDHPCNNFEVWLNGNPPTR